MGGPRVHVGCIQLDSIRQTARLPPKKFHRTATLLQSWARRRTCHRPELESLIGHLHHACKVVRPGRAFLRRMIELLAHFRDRVHPMRLNAEFRPDLHWWLAFFQERNGIMVFSFYPAYVRSPICLWHPMPLDLAGSAPCGMGTGSRLLGPTAPSIAFLELVPIVIAGHLWGHQWTKHHVQFLCDNTAVAGLSRFNFQEFRRLIPTPTPIRRPCLQPCSTGWFPRFDRPLLRSSCPGSGSF